MKIDSIRLCILAVFFSLVFLVQKTSLRPLYRWLVVFILLAAILSIVVEVCLYNVDPHKNLHQWTHAHLYGIDFDERTFPPRKMIPLYWSTVNDGYVVMKQTRLIIGGLCKDNAEGLPLFFARIEKLFPLFNDIRVVIYENDSKDNTRALLKAWEAKHSGEKRVHIIECPNDCKLNIADAKSTGTFSAQRMNKMARFRNELLTYIGAHQSEFDYCCMIDVDLKGPISIDGIAHSFGLQTKLNWDCISSYGLAGLTMSLNQLVYYDGLAYEPMERTIPQLSATLTAFQNSVGASFQPRGAEPWLVKSAFCGMALYKMSSIANILYDDQTVSATCEHITFHQRMAENGADKHYVNPNMILLAGLQGCGHYLNH